MGRHRKKRGAIVVALLLPSSALAWDGWYLGGSSGQASTDLNGAALTERLTNEGVTGTADVSDPSRAGARLFGGYAWNPYLAVEAGYTRLGDINMTLTGTGPLTAAQLEPVRPASGTGLEAAVLGRYAFSRRLSGFARAGLFHWEQKYQLSGGQGGSFSGDDAFYGVGAEWDFGNAWSARVSWDRYAVAHDETNLVGLGVVYRMASAAAPAVPTRAEPEPIAIMVAPAPVVEIAPPVVDVASPVAEPAPVQVAAPEPKTWVIRFAFKRTALQGHESVMAETTDYLAAHPEAHVRITGHADDSGAEGFHPFLSRLRAQAVADALTARGVDRARITVDAKGASEPVADNSHRAGRAQNRRVEIVIHGGGGMR